MKKVQWSLSFFLIILMSALFMPTVLGVSIVDSGECGENVSWTLDDSGKLSISGNGKMEFVYYSGETASGPRWEKYKNEIKSVVIEDGVSSIAYGAFCECVNLESVYIPTSVLSIESQAFAFCEKLASITIPKNVSVIEDEAFMDCQSLTEIIVDEQNTSFSTDFNSILYDKNKTILIQFPCGSPLTSFSIPTTVSSIGRSAFSHCNNLTDIVIPSNVKTIGDYAFYDCESLKSVAIQDGVESFKNGVFLYCDTIEYFSLPKSLISIGENCFLCHSLKHIFVDESNPSFTSDVFGCLYNKDQSILISYPAASSESSFEIPESVVTVSEGAFFNNKFLTEIIMHNHVQTIGMDAFVAMLKLKRFIVDNNNSHFSSDEQGVLYNKDHTILLQYPFGNNRTKYEIDNQTILLSENAGIGYAVSAIYIPIKVKTIQFDAIGNRAVKEGYDKLSDIYYEGSESQWEEISIDYFNNNLLDNVTIHFNASPEDMPNDETPHSHTPTTYTQPSTCIVPGYTITTCSVCGDQLGYAVLPLAAHQYGEWVTVKEPTTTEKGLRERTCTVCGNAKEQEEIPMLESFAAKDENSGITVSYGENTYADDQVQLRVEEDFTGSQYLIKSYDRYEAWNIKTYIDGAEAQPGQPVTVRIPLPEGYDPNSIAVYHVNSITGEAERINDVRVENGYIIFTATSFSLYIIVDESSAENPNMCHWCGRVHEGFFQKIIGFFHNILAKFFGNKY